MGLEAPSRAPGSSASTPPWQARTARAPPRSWPGAARDQPDHSSTDRLSLRRANESSSAAAHPSKRRRPGPLYHLEPDHHGVVLVLEDVAVPGVHPPVAVEARDDADHLSRVRAHGVLGPPLVFVRGLRRALEEVLQHRPRPL